MPNMNIPRYVGLLRNVVIHRPPTLPAGYEIRNADELEQAIFPCESTDWVFAVHENTTPPVGAEEDVWYDDRLRLLMRAVHLVLRTSGEGGVTIPAELVLYPLKDNPGFLGLYRVPLSYRVPWGKEDRIDVGAYEFTNLVEGRLIQFLSTAKWQPNAWDELDPLFRFADAIYRYYDKDRFVDYYLCMEALIVPEGSDAKGGLGSAFRRRGARFFASVDGEGVPLANPHIFESAYQDALRLLYKLRCSVLHGDTKKAQRKCLKNLHLDLKPESWTILAQISETYTRRLLRFFLRNAKIQMSSRTKFWRQDDQDASVGKRFSGRFA